MVDERNDRIAAQQSVTVMTMFIDRIHPVGNVMRVIREKLMMSSLGPSAVPFGMVVMAALYFLQKNQIRIEPCNRFFHVVNTRLATKGAHAFMHVIGGDPEFHTRPPWGELDSNSIR